MLIFTILFFVLATQHSWAQIPETMSYQGVLTDASGTPLSGSYSLLFIIYDFATGGNWLWAETHRGIEVVDGVFSVILGETIPLNLAFDKQYWLAIAIEGGVELTPRIRLTSAPYSLNARSVADNAVTAAKILPDVVSSVDGVSNDGGDIDLVAGTNITITPNDAANTITISSTGGGSFSGWSLTGNSGTIPGTNFLGTTDDQPLELWVNSLRAMRLSPHSTSPNIIGGYKDNWIGSSVYGAIVAGGGQFGEVNRVTDRYGVVSGGSKNQAGDDAGTVDDANYATVGGGYDNTASGSTATVSGGSGNVASGAGAAIGGGISNNATVDLSTIAGGSGNIVTDDNGTVGGGKDNQAGDNAGTTEDASFATVGGGSDNKATSICTTIGGGNGNEASEDYATVAGGINNEATAHSATISGGSVNEAIATHTTIGGGYGNQATGQYSTIDGGYGNEANGECATVGGGRYNVANAPYATIAGGGSNEPVSPQGNRVTDWFGTIGGGKDNQAGDNAGTTADASCATIGGGRDNIASGWNTTVGGGINNTASGDNAAVGGGGGNTSSGYFASISGGYSNTASGSYATVGGGESNAASSFYTAVGGGFGNRVTDNYGVVGGGGNNLAGNDNTATDDANFATVSGGEDNVASGYHSTVGGGLDNEATGHGATIGGGGCYFPGYGYSGNEASGNLSTVGGGYANHATGFAATVCGGEGNIASGMDATVCGGMGNTASGDRSFAAGRYASAQHNGCFVWGDDTAASVTSTGEDQFIARASGGVWFYSKSDLTKGVRLDPDATNWTGFSTSDKSLKHNIRQMDGRDVLNRLVQIPISRWAYRSQDPRIEHIGPMSQDFHAAFGVGADDRHIDTVDADGVALAAIQGLYELVKEKDAKIIAQQEQIATLEARLAALEAIVSSERD